MKSRWIAVCVISITCAASADAQSSISAFWVKFKTAVTKGDKAAVANMTKLPFSLGYDPSAKGGERFLKTRASFLRQYKYIFNNEVDAVKCFANAAPEKEEKGYFVACSFKSDPDDREKPLIYSFTHTKQGWKFAVFENINE